MPLDMYLPILGMQMWRDNQELGLSSSLLTSITYCNIEYLIISE